MAKLFCIGDVHGCSKTLSDLLMRLRLDKDDQIIFIGDYIDRGPDSRGVIDQILDLRAKGFQVTTLLGNHEYMFIETLDPEADVEFWEDRCGGLQTLASFGVASYRDLDPVYRSFFQGLEFHVKIEGHIFVHAGLDFSTPDIFENRYAMLWARQTVVDTKKLGRKRIIHGHTPQPRNITELQRQRIRTNRILNIDNGCVYPHVEGLGYLTAYELTENMLYHVPCMDMG